MKNLLNGTISLHKHWVCLEATVNSTTHRDCRWWGLSETNNEPKRIQRDVCTVSHFSHVWLFETLWIEACQTPLSMEFSRQEYWSELLCPPQGIFPTQGLNPSLCIPGGFFTAELPGKPLITGYSLVIPKTPRTGHLCSTELIWISYHPSVLPVSTS